MKKTLLILLCAFVNAALLAQVRNDVVTRLNGDAGKVKVEVPEALRERLLPENGNPTISGQAKQQTQLTGYRIQIFSDNNSKTAKREAEYRGRQIESQFPQLRSYITYKAPSWRLRMGDFRTRSEAVDALSQLKSAFPGYAREMTVVVDRVTIRTSEEY